MPEEPSLRERLQNLYRTIDTIGGRLPGTAGNESWTEEIKPQTEWGRRVIAERQANDAAIIARRRSEAMVQPGGLLQMPRQPRPDPLNIPPTPPPPAGWGEPDPLVVGSPSEARLVKLLMDRDPALRGLISQVDFGPIPSMMGLADPGTVWQSPQTGKFYDAYDEIDESTGWPRRLGSPLGGLIRYPSIREDGTWQIDPEGKSRIAINPAIGLSTDLSRGHMDSRLPGLLQHEFLHAKGFSHDDPEMSKPSSQLIPRALRDELLLRAIQPPSPRRPGWSTSPTGPGVWQR